MINVISAPDNVAAFRATGEITKEDYQTVVEPTVQKLVDRINEINFLFLIDTEIEKFYHCCLDRRCHVRTKKSWKMEQNSDCYRFREGYFFYQRI